MPLERRRFREQPNPAEVLALDPKAFELYFADPVDTGTKVEDGVALVPIRGPLEHRAGWWWDSYESILCRFACALGDPDVRAVILDIDSPGGEVSGLNETVRLMRRMKERASKPVYSYANEAAFSAAYALATVGDLIILPEAGGVGSVGVITALCDRTKMNEKLGLRFEVITSGSRKGDGHPDLPISEEAIKRQQKRVNDLAEQFFQLVADVRPLTVDAIRGYQAMTYYGADAVKRGLADAVMPFRRVVRMSRLANPAEKRVPSDVSESPSKEMTPMTAKDLRSLLSRGRAKLAKVKNEEEQRALRAWIADHERMLAKKMIDEEDEAEEEEEDDAEDEEDEAEDSEAGEGDEEDDEEDDEDDDDSKSGTDKSTTGSESEDEEDDDEAKATTGLHTKDRLLRMCRQITGKRSIAEVMGTLDAWARGAREHEKLARKVDKMSSDTRRMKVDAMIKQARRDGVVMSPELKAELRAMGIESPKRLRGFLDAMPRSTALREEREQAHAAPRVAVDGKLAEVAARMGVTLEQVGDMAKSTLRSSASPPLFGAKEIPVAIPGVPSNLASLNGKVG